MTVGIDIGGTTTKLGLVRNGQVVATSFFSTQVHRAPSDLVDALAASVNTLLSGPLKPSQAERDGLRVGIGAPNGDQLSGIINEAPNLPWKGHLPLRDLLEARLGIPCTLGNDANAAALGELRYGAGIGCTDLLVVTLGTGLGSGLIVDGALLLGPRGDAGELGHITLIPEGRPCTCGRRGCLEAYVSIRGIRATYDELSPEDPVLIEDGVKPVADAAHAGSVAALHTFEVTARWLAIGLANAVALVPPQRIVLVGGIARSGDLLLNPLRPAFEEALLQIHRGKVALGLGKLPNDDAGVLGAAALTTMNT